MMPQDFARLETLPLLLASEHYPQVGHLMLTDVPGEPKPPTAVCVVTPDAPPDDADPSHITAFKRQLNQLAQWPWTIPDGAPIPAGAYVAASEGDIPLLDAVRGFCMARGAEEPLLAGPDHTSSLWRPLQHLGHVAIITHDATHAVEDALQAAKALYSQGVQQVSILRGRYYASVRSADIDATRLTSSHKEFMTAIGALCVW